MTVAPFVALVLPLAYAILRRYSPRDTSVEVVPEDARYLPYGVSLAIMWTIGLGIAIGGYFGLRGVNHLFASMDRGSTLVLYPTAILWCFAPGFAALCLPWLTTLWMLRRTGYTGEAQEIVIDGNDKMNWNGERVMRWACLGIVAPIFLFTLAALPMRLSMDNNSVRVTHYAHLTPEIFPLADARHAFTVDGYLLRDGTLQSRPDLLIDFADGRRLAATAMSDGGDPPPQAFVDALLSHTGLHLTHVRTEHDIPNGQ
ncbi:MAG TPA: hypothetical protein VGN01_17680 [Acidobacteriaceae bacterium]|jgi:MFS family permease